MEEKDLVQAAKEKENKLEKKVQDEVARINIEKKLRKKSEPLQEYDDPFSQIKAEDVKRNDEILESTNKFNTRIKACDTMRTNSLFRHKWSCLLLNKLLQLGHCSARSRNSEFCSN